MEQFKEFNKITLKDERHILFGQITGDNPNLEEFHEYIGEFKLNENVPEHIRGQFNVAKNMALYTFFCYSLAPEVHVKAYSVMELAIRGYYKNDRKTNLRTLVKRAVENGLITDKNFRHVPDDPENTYSKTFANIYPDLRNTMAHGTTILLGHCGSQLERCVDFINQLYKDK